MTKTVEAIVTALGEGPCSALGLSQRLPNVTHANARQTLRRLATVGVVTRLLRGHYGLCDSGHCDNSHCDTSTITKGSARKAAKPSRPLVTPRVYSDAEIAAAVQGAWTAFEAQDDLLNPDAWR